MSVKDIELKDEKEENVAPLEGVEQKEKNENIKNEILSNAPKEEKISSKDEPKFKPLPDKDSEPKKEKKGLKIFGILVLILICIVVICFLLYSKQIFYDYLLDVTFLYSVVILIILLSLFIFFYASYFYLKDIQFLLTSNKYVKKVLPTNSKFVEFFKKKFKKLIPYKK